jgi:hypothetical protein
MLQEFVNARGRLLTAERHRRSLSSSWRAMGWLRRQVGAAHVRALARSWASVVAGSGGPSAREFLAGPAAEVVAALVEPDGTGTATTRGSRVDARYAVGPTLTDDGSPFVRFGRYHGVAGRDADELQDWLVALEALLAGRGTTVERPVAAAVRAGWAEGARERAAG